MNEPTDHQRPPGVSDEVVAALGTLSEAYEYVVRARGHLYEMHQLMGHADFLFGDAADDLEQAGCAREAAEVRQDVVGRNIVDGRWTFQLVEEFDRIYYRFVEDLVRRYEAVHVGGRRHVFEAELKEKRRSAGRLHHEARPPGAHSPLVDTDGER
jgi:hypothetical protein